ncbi:MAG: DUF1993 domain-containing protein [Deltaproteobacteria bacterium]|nr:MAG: DUF1993 domain-containing protein [Deltaproteobacteria bacterium]
MYDELVPYLVKYLGNLDGWLDEAEKFAEERGFEVDVLVDSRLAPDMFPLSRQVQAACDTAKFLAARLSDAKAPVDADDETTLGQLRERIAKTLAFLDGIDAEALADCAGRTITVNFLPPGTGLTGQEYARGFGLPNFFFHVNMAYAILRHNGVPLGKRAYIGSLDILRTA